MTGFLTTHVLDTARGCPAKGLVIDLIGIEGDTRTHLVTMTTNGDGRTDGPILPPETFALGRYELVFHAGPYLRSMGDTDAFLDEVPIRFGMSEQRHYHVPLLLSAFGFSTYRGS